MKQLIAILIFGSVTLAIVGCSGGAQPGGRQIAGGSPKAAPGAEAMRQALISPIDGKKK